MYIIVTSSKEIADQAKINGAEVFECGATEAGEGLKKPSNLEVLVGRFL